MLQQTSQAELFKANNHVNQKVIDGLSVSNNRVSVANINKDGVDDLVITNYEDQGLIIYLGQTNGGLQELFTTPVIGSVDISAVLDVDADGDDDIWLTLWSSEGESDVILINDGSGRFSQRTVVTNENYSFRFANNLLSADIDNDGDVDVVKVVRDDDPLGSFFRAEFFINDGAGNFVLDEKQLNVSEFTHFNDFNNDGFLDVITGHRDLQVYYNDPAGFFQEPAEQFELDLPFGLCGMGVNYPPIDKESMLFADIDNDGDLDIQVVSKTLGLARRINNGDGTFSASSGPACLPQEVSPIGSNRPIDLKPIQSGVLVDYNQDGLKDLWVGSASEQQSFVLLTAPDGFLSTDKIELDENGVSYLVAGKFNQDNTNDVVSVGFKGINQWLFDGAMNYSKVDLQQVNQQWGFVSLPIAEDFDGDDIIDLIYSQQNGVFYRSGNGAGAFGSPVNVSSIDLHRIRALDFDNNGVMDVMGFGFTAGQLTLIILLYDDQGNHEAKELQIPNELSGISRFDVSDFDGDGDFDLLMVLNVGIYIYQNQGDADFELIQHIENNWYSAAQFVDLNNLGRKAFLAYSYVDFIELIESYQEWVWNGSVFEMRRLARADRTEYKITTFDFDGDGDLDILSSTRTDNGQRLLIINETDYFAPSQYFYPGSVVEFATDLNNDGLTDYIDYDSSVYLGQSAEAFTLVTESAELGNISGLVDLDGDGDLDVVGVSVGLETHLNQTNNIELSGLWFNPNQDGHGLSLEQLMVNGQPSVVFSWFAVHEDDPFWLVGMAPLSGNKAQIEVSYTSGTGFGAAFNSQDVERTAWGTVTLEQVDNNKLDVAWQPINNDFQSGQMQMQRLVVVKETAAQPHTLNSCHSGSWYNPSQDGHGIFVQITDLNGQDTLVVSWYHYFENKQTWMVGQGPIEGQSASVTLYSGRGGLFPPNYVSDDATKELWGELSFKLLSNAEALISWDSTQTGFGGGELRLEKLTELDRYHCPQ